ncbi:MAG: molybdopterin synthase sulfur carrier subunit [Flavobacteriaceae bacterium]|nr:MAG: molybdopterin synthase sulfur carrier subunit [Flavobacteriaceae bacterium]
MNLRILFFGISADLVGETSLDLSVSVNISVFQLKKELQEQYPQLLEINSYAIAVNECYATDETLLRENDVMAIIPPVSGG